MLCLFAKGREARHRQKQERPRSQRCYPFGRGRQGRAGDHHATWLPLPLLFLKPLGAEALRQIKKRQEHRIRGLRLSLGVAPPPQFRLAITRQARHITCTARPMWARTLRSDGKDYRAEYEHDELSPNNLKPPDALSGERPAMRNL